MRYCCLLLVLQWHQATSHWMTFPLYNKLGTLHRLQSEVKRQIRELLRIPHFQQQEKNKPG